MPSIPITRSLHFAYSRVKNMIKDKHSCSLLNKTKVQQYNVACYVYSILNFSVNFFSIVKYKHHFIDSYADT